MNGYEAYKKYVALKLHFQQDNYDYFKFSGSVKVSKEKFDTRNDKYFFQRVAKIYNEKQFEQLLVANFINNKNVWVGDVFSDVGRSLYAEWKKTYQSLEYSFAEDMKKLKDILDDSPDLNNFDCLFSVSADANWPELVSITLQQTIKIESFIVMNKILNFIPRFDRQITDTLVWPEFRNLCLKYSPFLDVNLPKFKKIMKSCFVENNS